MQEKTNLKTVDRIWLLALAVGVCAVLGALWLQPAPILAHDDGHTRYEYAEEGHNHDSGYGLESVVESVIATLSCT